MDDVLLIEVAIHAVLWHSREGHVDVCVNLSYTELTGAATRPVSVAVEPVA
jgi:hypothetical protein